MHVTPRTLVACAAALAATVWPVAVSAQSEFPYAHIAWSGGTITAELHINADTAVMIFRAADGTARPSRTIDTVEDALAILADERLAFAWPAILAWGGDDLHVLRDKALTHAERAAAGTARPIPATGRARLANWSKDARAFLQYITALDRSGRAGEAIARLRGQIAANGIGADPLVGSLLRIILARHVLDSGDADQAIALLQDASTTARSNAARINVDVNLAATLARTGHFEQALQIDDATEQKFDHSSSGILVGHSKLPDSDVYFAAIRACALNGLGRRDEARRVIDSIAIEPITTLDLPAKAEARLFASSCMHDAAGLADNLAAMIRTAPPAAQVVLQFQPARETIPAERTTLVAALATDVAEKAMAGRVRVLDGNLAQAVSSWRDTPPAIAH